MYTCLSMCNDSCIKCVFMAFWSSKGLSRQQKFISSSFTPNSMIIITCIDDLMNIKGRIVLVMAFEILFLSYLMQHDDTARVVATCRMLVG